MEGNLKWFSKIRDMEKSKTLASLVFHVGQMYRIPDFDCCKQILLFWWETYPEWEANEKKKYTRLHCHCREFFWCDLKEVCILSLILNYYCSTCLVWVDAIWSETKIAICGETPCEQSVPTGSRAGSFLQCVWIERMRDVRWRWGAEGTTHHQLEYNTPPL